MIHVEIVNFQSIKNISFDIDGFTTIVGRNFIGKSAVMRAINAALTNASGDDFINWGEKFCEVKLQTEGMDLLWHKEEGNNFYVVNGKKYTKVGRSDPPSEISDAGFGVTMVGKEKLNLLYVEQFFPIFLLDKKDSKSIDLLTAAYGLDKVYKAIDLCSKDQRSNKDMLRIRKKDLDILKEEVKKYEGFDEILAQKSDLVKRKKAIDLKEMKIKRLKDLLVRLTTITSQVRSLQNIKDVVVPKGGHLKPAVSKIERLELLLTSYNNLAPSVEKLKPVEEVGIPSDTSSLDSLSKKLKISRVFQTKYDLLSGVVSRLEAVKKIKIPEKPNIEFEKIKVLEGRRKEVLKIRDEFVITQEAYEAAKKEEEELIAQKDEFKGVCPLCGGEMEDKK
jgi:hypothetical protein